jgi:hypothetical protein
MDARSSVLIDRRVFKILKMEAVWRGDSPAYLAEKIIFNHVMKMRAERLQNGEEYPVDQNKKLEENYKTDRELKKIRIINFIKDSKDGVSKSDILRKFAARKEDLNFLNSEHRIAMKLQEGLGRPKTIYFYQ